MTAARGDIGNQVVDQDLNWSKPFREKRSAWACAQLRLVARVRAALLPKLITVWYLQTTQCTLQREYKQALRSHIRGTRLLPISFDSPPQPLPPTKKTIGFYRHVRAIALVFRLTSSTKISLTPACPAFFFARSLRASWFSSHESGEGMSSIIISFCIGM